MHSSPAVGRPHPSIYPAVSFKFHHEKYDRNRTAIFMQARQAYIIQLTTKKNMSVHKSVHGVVLPIGVQSLDTAAIKLRNLYP